MKKYTLTVTYDGENNTLISRADGFSDNEVIGFLTAALHDVLDKAWSDVKPDIIRQECVKGEEDSHD